MKISIRNKNKESNNSKKNTSDGFVRVVKNGVVARVRNRIMWYIGQVVHSIRYSFHCTFATKRTTPFSTTGFVILFAVLASTLILAMAVSIFNVAYKEQVLSGTTKASAYADAGANVGLECALYNDIKKHLFPDLNFQTGFPAGTAPGGISVPAQINCVGQDELIDVNQTGVNDFTFTIETEDGYGIFVGNSPAGVHTNTNRPGCVKVFVDKDESLTADGYMTHVVSRGYNVRCSDLQTLSDGTINPRIVERRSEVRYNSKGVPGSGGNIPVTDIWATIPGESPVGQGSGGGSISVGNTGEDQYDISWNSANVLSCSETVTYNGSLISQNGNPLNFPQNTANDTKSTTIGTDGAPLGTYVYTINCIDLSGNAVPPQSVNVEVTGGGGSFDIPSLSIKASGKGGNPPETEIEVTLNPTQIEGTISWYPLHVKNCAGSSSGNTSWPISNPIPAINGSFTLSQMFPTTYPVGDFSSRIYTISCEWGDSTEFPGVSITKSVKVNYQPVGVILPAANIWADPAIGANVGEFSSGGLLTLTQADAPYAIRWNSSNAISCTETVEITSSGQILNGAHGFPQSVLTGSSTIDPSFIEPGDYTYRISCTGPSGTANDFVNVNVTETPIVSSLDLQIKLASESTYHTYPAGQTSLNGGMIDLNAVTLPSGVTALCDSGSPCEANQTVNLDWTGVNVSNCTATAKYKISTDALPAWNTPTSVSVTGQFSIFVAHYGVTRFIITCDKVSGGQISDTVYANLETQVIVPSYIGTVASGDFYVPENVGSLSIGMGSFGGRGGTTSADGVDGDKSYFNKDNGTINGQDYLVVYGGKGGKQSVALGGTANGGLGANVYYPAGSIVSYGALGIYLLGYTSGESGYSTTTNVGGAGGIYQNGIETIVTSSTSGGTGNGLPSVTDGGAGSDGTAGLTGGGGGGSGGYLFARFSVVSSEKFKFKGTSRLPISPSFGPGTAYLVITTIGETSFSSPY